MFLLNGLPAGQLIAGAWLSVTFTVMEQFEASPEASVAVQVIMVVPLGIFAPASVEVPLKLLTIIVPVQLSEKVGLSSLPDTV